MLQGPLGLPLTAKRSFTVTSAPDCASASLRALDGILNARSIAKTTVSVLTIHWRNAPYGGGWESDMLIRIEGAAHMSWG
jgi:hypothetical protein